MKNIRESAVIYEYGCPASIQANAELQLGAKEFFKQLAKRNITFKVIVTLVLFLFLEKAKDRTLSARHLSSCFKENAKATKITHFSI